MWAELWLLLHIYSMWLLRFLCILIKVLFKQFFKYWFSPVVLIGKILVQYNAIVVNYWFCFALQDLHRLSICIVFTWSLIYIFDVHKKKNLVIVDVMGKTLEQTKGKHCIKMSYVNEYNSINYARYSIVNIHFVEINLQLLLKITPTSFFNINIFFNHYNFLFPKKKKYNNFPGYQLDIALISNAWVIYSHWRYPYRMENYIEFQTSIKAKPM